MAPRPPAPRRKRDLAYDTSKYRAWSPGSDLTGRIPAHAEMVGGGYKYDVFDHYRLVKHPNIQNSWHQVPRDLVRLDDNHCAHAIRTMPRRSLKIFVADFDTRGMIPATRLPLGYAAKIYCNVGDRDIDGNLVQSGQEGWYYLWYKGIHCLKGAEGWDAEVAHALRTGEDLMTGHVSFAKEYKDVELGFKIGHRAVVQMAVTEPNHPAPSMVNPHPGPF